MKECFLSDQNQEGKKKEIKVLTNEELRSKVFSENTVLINKKFKPFNEGGALRYFQTECLNFQTNGSEFFWPVVRNKKREIIGISSAVKHKDQEDNFWYLYFLFIVLKFQEKWYASNLIKEILKFFKKNNLSLKTASYISESSWIKLKTLFERYSEQYNVLLFENDKKMGWK